MNKKNFFRRGQGSIEYIILLVFIVGAFLIFQKYIVRAFSGRWKAVGDSFGEGQIYDPNLTLQCRVDTRYPGFWFDAKEFEEHCRGVCFGIHYDDGECRRCIATINDPRCDD